LDGLDHGTVPLDVQRQILAIIVQENQRLSRMINQVLDLSKIEAGEMDWQMEPLDLDEVVTHAVSANRALFDDKAIVLTTRRDPEPISVLGDRDKLIQVVTNLLSNAAKFTATGGSVAIRAVREGGLAVVKVQDSGIGIPPGQIETIFEKFHQVGDTLTAKPEGTGLGLPISREIVERHDGTLTAHASGGSGSCFRMALPLAGPETDAPRPRQAPPDVGASDGAAERSAAPAPAADVRIA